jgi:hypothetical protein
VPRESKVQSWCIQWARARSILVTKNDTRANAGVLDYNFWLPGGRPLVVEFKAEGGSFRPGQEAILDGLITAGYAAVVVVTEKEFLQAVEGVLRSGRPGSKAVKN